MLLLNLLNCSILVSTRIQELEENHKREIAKLQREIRNLKESKEDEIRALKTLSRRQTVSNSFFFK